jgi:hypothetical protein
MPPGWLPPPDEPMGANTGGMRRRITPGVAATGGDAHRIEQLQRQQEGEDDNDDDDESIEE